MTRLLILALSLALALPARAAPPAFPPAAENFRAGMEVELGAQHFAKLTGLFDFDAFQTELSHDLSEAEVSPSVFDDYLRDSPAALASLPEEVRAELTRGLELSSLVEKGEVELPADVPRKTGLILGTTPPEKKPVLLGLDGKTTLRTSPERAPLDPRFGEKEGGLALPKRLDWETLYARWKKLPFAEKAKLARWESLGPNRKAELAVALLQERVGRKRPANRVLPLKSDLPPTTKALMERLLWSADGEGVVEFAHVRPVHSPQALYDDIEAFGRLAGVESKLLRPSESKLQKVGLHYHVSGSELQLDPWIESYNKLQSLRRINAGIVNDMRGGSYNYAHEVQEKGLVRRIAPNHFEQRAHLLPLRQELTEVTKLTALSPPKATRYISEQIAGLLTDENVRRMLRNNVYFPDEFTHWLSEGQKASVAKAQARFEAITGKIGSPELWRRVPFLLRSPRPDLRILGMRSLVLGNPPADFWPHFPALIKDPRVQTSALRDLLRKSPPPARIETEIVRALAALPPEEHARVLALAPVVWKDPDPALAKSFTAALLHPETEFFEVIQSLDDLPTRLLGPSELKQLLALEGNRGITMRDAVLSYALRSREMDAGTWRALADFVRTADSDDMYGVAAALGKHSAWPPEIIAAVEAHVERHGSLAQSPLRDGLSLARARAAEAYGCSADFGKLAAH